MEWPNPTFHSGAQAVTREVLNDSAEGCVVISQGDAPFGDFCVAGTELPVPDENFTGADYPDQDRIWNSQTGWMYVRE
ncbi:hypothetical protein [Gulosibacter sp. ACHW.36C]|uniref:Uncharacterized protein n=1 Tax=Gulosibacter sediminis TaxID=1729695 RepID=A0ABY4MU61_9MICO|nr:hypothetical protein [Gulosibacter sediminis]UQN13955.1 hypothetical protein M3M28_07720 [Gulosibacter sediminis]